MAKVLTLNDIAGMTDKKQLILSKDTIITPAARDWAKEKGISIIGKPDGIKIRSEEKDVSQTPIVA